MYPILMRVTVYIQMGEVQSVSKRCNRLFKYCLLTSVGQCWVVLTIGESHPLHLCSSVRKIVVWGNDLGGIISNELVGAWKVDGGVKSSLLLSLNSLIFYFFHLFPFHHFLSNFIHNITPQFLLSITSFSFHLLAHLSLILSLFSLQSWF